jgi:hypothetical protein
MMKTSIKTWLAGAGLSLLLGGVAVLTPGCAGTVAYTPGYYGAGYDYDYYPGLNVYYYPAGGYYHWYDGGRWNTGRHLPPRYTIGHAPHERMHSQTQEPWREHEHH